MKISELKFPHIGMRTFKTALSVTIGLYLARLLNIHSPLFVTIASVMTMQPSFYETYKSVRMRIVTCIVGVLLGIALGNLGISLDYLPIIAGLGIIFVVVMMQQLKLTRMIALTCTIFVASYIAEIDALDYGVERITGTMVGVAVSLIVNYIIAAPKVADNLGNILFETYEDVMEISKALVLTKEKIDLDVLSKDIDEANSIYKLTKNEIRQPLAPIVPVEDLEKIIDDYNRVFVLLRMLSTIPGNNHLLTDENRDCIGKVFKYTVIYDEEMGEIPDIVYNYHIETLLKTLIEVGKLHEGVVIDEFGI